MATITAKLLAALSDKKNRYLRPPILNAIELAAPAGHRAL